LEGTITVSNNLDQQKDPVNISCEEELKTNTTVSMTPGRKCSEAAEVTPAINILKHNEGTGTQQQPVKRQKKKNSIEGSGFFMEFVRPTLNVVHTSGDDEVIHTVEALDLGSNEDQIGKFEDWDLGLMHHNVQSLNNKLLNIAMMLTLVNLNLNILRFTEHWLLEDQMNTKILISSD
jgi:hypothetical protein